MLPYGLIKHSSFIFIEKKKLNHVRPEIRRTNLIVHVCHDLKHHSMSSTQDIICSLFTEDELCFELNLFKTVFDSDKNCHESSIDVSKQRLYNMFNLCSKKNNEADKL